MPNRTQTWIATALSLFLVFVLPVCWSGSLTRSWIECGQGPGSNTNNTNEEREEREISENEDGARVGSRPGLAKPLVEASLQPARVAHADVAILTSVAPRPHPSRFSVKQLR